jgi:predicted amino acid racemase
MFLQKLRERNPKLLDTALELHSLGKIRPDTWVVDLDSLLNNAALILSEARKRNIVLYYMTKQFGRNPLIARYLQKMGYAGAVAVDYKEAQVLLQKKLRLGHVGHLVQVPVMEVPKILKARPEIVTVYSYEKAAHFSEEALKMKRVQPIMLRMWNEKKPVPLGREAGYSLSHLDGLLWRMEALKGIRIGGITAYPCFFYDEGQRDIVPTENVELLGRTRLWLQEHLPSPLSLQVNMPTATCVRTLPLIADAGGTHAEPGHGLTGTTPLHAVEDQPEVPAMVYVTEVSHHWGRSSMVYGGGLYRAGHLRGALVEDKTTMVYPSDPAVIDYHLEIDGQFSVGTPVLMAYRVQAFVTRSDIAVVQGIHTKKGKGKLLGIFDPLGAKLA